ncbi:hypothetical protein B0H17DRAFT_1091606 [Mycena rosella]|uniref:F-box domain-containing protein n=1 Tax=Mycena rosella TaxID=1033263 RepID=A0AAD7G4B2_MYCRO|nr:hypothetical protein B0H17DRAFT_1091606 [Mycena rosella]
MSTQSEEQPSLPAELTDEIIGWIGASPTPWRDLSSCSLVCKVWLPASRSHLFHSIQITLGKATRWNAFLKSSHLTAYLRHVEILEKPELTRELTYEQAQAQTDKVYELLPHIAQLTTVQSLCVDVISWVPLEDEHVTCLCSAFRNVTHLELRNAKIRDNAQLMHILSHFTLLERVSLARVKRNLRANCPLTSTQSQILYRKAVLGPEDWLCGSYPLTSVRHLELCDIPSSENRLRGQSHAALGRPIIQPSSLFHVSADFVSSIPTHFQPRFNPMLRTVHIILDLDQYSVLRRFFCSLTQVPDGAPYPENASWTWLPLFLSEIPSALESLALDINGELFALNALDWRPSHAHSTGPIQVIAPVVPSEETPPADVHQL